MTIWIYIIWIFMLTIGNGAPPPNTYGYRYTFTPYLTFEMKFIIIHLHATYLTRVKSVSPAFPRVNALITSLRNI